MHHVVEEINYSASARKLLRKEKVERVQGVEVAAHSIRLEKYLCELRKPFATSCAHQVQAVIVTVVAGKVVDCRGMGLESR